MAVWPEYKGFGSGEGELLSFGRLSRDGTCMNTIHVRRGDGALRIAGLQLHVHSRAFCVRVSFI